MTRLVLHVGTRTTGAAPLVDELVRSRDLLLKRGVWLPPDETAAAWNASATELAEGGVPEPLAETLVLARQADARMVLLGSERLEDTVRDPMQLSNLQAFAAECGLQLTVLVVVRDQLGYLNELYCERVTQLQMARDFGSFVEDPQPAERFDYATAYGPVIDEPDVELVAVPFSTVRERGVARTVLTTLGIPAKDLRPLPDVRPPEPLPGPVLVAATRLLFKRMWRMGLIKHLSRPRLVAAALALRTHAEEQSWDETEFWGWTEEARAAAIARYAPGNDDFAQAVWGQPWGEPWANGTYVDVDFAAGSAQLVVDMMRTVDGLVKELQQVKNAAAGAALPE